MTAEGFPRWIAGAGFPLFSSHRWFGSCAYYTAPGKSERSARCRHNHRNYETAKACGEKMVARRKRVPK